MNLVATSRVLAIIVTYNPDIKKFGEMLSRVIGSSIDVTIIDNNSVNYSDISRIAAINGIKTTYLEKNYGLAYAQNYAICKYCAPTHEYILMLDQDSLLREHAVDRLVANADSLIAEGMNVAAVGPRFIDQENNYQYPFIIINKLTIRKVFKSDHNISVSLLISSGMLINVKSLNKIGLMKTEFFIDHIDTEWCFRALAKGYKLYGVPSAVMHHSVGEKSVSFFGMNLPIHSATRRFYRARNFVFLLKQSYSPLSWKIKEITSAPIKIVFSLLSTNDKAQHIAALLRGFRDGITSNFSR